MEHLRLVLRALSGAVLSASILGLAEAGWSMRAGCPDGLAPLYAVVLYGLIGAPLGVAVAIALVIWRRFAVVTDERAVAIGAVGSSGPMALFILRYLANRDLYGEQGIPLAGNLAILGVVTAVAVLVLLAVPALLRGLLSRANNAGGFGAVGAILVAIGVLVRVAWPVDDPRGHMAHNKPIPAALTDKPNVLFVMVDTLRADHVGAYGGTVSTPAMDALANDGVVFENAYANASWTRASGASLLTSRLPSGHDTQQKASRLPDEVVTWAEALRPAGIATGALVDNINLAGSFNFDQGYDSFLYEAPAYRFGATEGVFGLTFYKVVQKVAERVLHSGKDVHTFYQPADVVLADAKAFVEANKDGRWALYVHLMEPHDPYFEHPVIEGTGPDEYDGVGFARAEVERPDPADTARLQHLYAGEVAFLDTKLAPFFAWMRAEGLYDNTIIVFTADHGEEFYEHGGFWHGTTLYDEVVHVPLIVKMPNNAHHGVRVGWQVSSIDVAPTIASAVGVAPDPSWEGTPLQPLIASWLLANTPAPPPPPIAPSEDGAVHDTAEPPVADAPVPVEVPIAVPRGPCDPPDANERPVYAEEDFEGNLLASVRMGGFKYIKANANNPRGVPERELFQVAIDPAEKANLVGTASPVCGSYPDSREKTLDSDLGARILQSKSHATGGGTVKMGAAECERLKALGYMDPNTECN